LRCSQSERRSRPWLNARCSQRQSRRPRAPWPKKLSEAARGEAARRAGAKAKPKPTPVRKAARKELMEQLVAPAVETVTVEHPRSRI
jgi:hypothetical protein